MPAAPKWSPSAPGLVEDPESGEYNLAERQTFTQIYNGKYADCVAGKLAKGAIGSGDTDGYIVQSCRVTKASGGRGKLMIVWENIVVSGTVLPADEFGLNPQDLSPATEKNPAFDDITSAQYEKIKAAVFSSNDLEAGAARFYIDELAPDAGGPNDQTKALHALLKRGVTNYYKPFFTYYWVQYFTSEPGFNTGAYIEAPGGPLSSAISGLSLSCLRQADGLDFVNGLYRRTRSWMCATDAYWDTTLY